MPQIVLEGVSKSYGDVVALRDVSLSFEDNVTTTVIGPSGSGKSTLLQCINGLVRPDAGGVQVFGKAVDHDRLSELRLQIGYAVQGTGLFPHLTVRDNLLYGYRRTPPALRRIDPSNLIDLLDLEPLLDRRPATLSGGEAQRVALARAVATSPEALLLDEPLASLDGALRGRILRYLKALHQELALPMIYVSHSLSEVLFLADQVIVLSKGEMVAQGEPYQLLYQLPVKPLVDLASLENLLEAEVVAHHPESGLTEVRALGDQTLWVPQLHRPPGTRFSLALRAADILIATQVPQHLSARNVLRATITALEEVGDTVLVTAEAGAPLLVEVTQGARVSLGLAPGLEVFLVIKSSSILALD